MATAADSTTPPVKDVRYNAADGDYAYYLNGELVRYAPTRLQAEHKLDELVYALLECENVTACDLTPEEAEAVLEAQQIVAAEDAATAALVELEHQAGAEETCTLRKYPFMSSRTTAV